MRSTILGSLFTAQMLHAQTPMLKEISCVPQKDAKASLIYLHGLDPEPTPREELNHRQMVTELAAKNKLNLFIPRSTILCKERYCWPNNDPKLHKEVYDAILIESKKCLGDAQPLILLGFSNGGFFSSKVATYCYSGVAAVIASGSYGSLTDVDLKRIEPAKCPSIALTIGSGDLSYAKAKKYYADLKKAGYKVSFDSFPAKHELSRKVLQSKLHELSTSLANAKEPKK
jgi:hypothetical protein